MYAIIRSIPLAIFMVVFPFNEYGLAVFATWFFTGYVCFSVEWVRNIMIGTYIVGGFWYVAAMSM